MERRSARDDMPSTGGLPSHLPVVRLVTRAPWRGPYPCAAYAGRAFSLLLMACAGGGAPRWPGVWPVVSLLTRGIVPKKRVRSRACVLVVARSRVVLSGLWLLASLLILSRVFVCGLDFLVLLLADFEFGCVLGRPCASWVCTRPACVVACRPLSLQGCPLWPCLGCFLGRARLVDLRYRPGGLGQFFSSSCTDWPLCSSRLFVCPTPPGGRPYCALSFWQQTFFLSVACFAQHGSWTRRVTTKPHVPCV